MSASIREQVASTLWATSRAHVLKLFGVPGAPPKWEWEDHSGRKPFYAEADAGLAVVRDAVLTEIDRRIVPVTWITPGKYMARNEALTDLRAAVAELLGA